MNPSPSYLYVSSKIGFQMQKRTFLAKMLFLLFLLRFGCCFCCFSKSREPGDVATYFYFFNTTSSSSEWMQKSTVRNPNFESLDQCQIFAKSISLIFVVNELFLSFKIAIFEICVKKDWTNFEKKLRFGILNSLTLSLSLSLSSPPPPTNEHFGFIIVSDF